MDRQKLLLLALVVIALGYGGDWAYRSWVEEPFRRQEAEQTKLEKTQSSLHDRTIRAKTLVRDLPDFEDRSLPANAVAARQAYQAWCWQWVKRHEIANPTIDVSQPRVRQLSKTNKKDAEPDMYELVVTIRGVAALQVVVDLLADFHQTKFLHRIDALSLTPVSQGRQLSFTISVSALSLRTATLTDRLPGQSAADLNVVQGPTAEGENIETVTADPSPRIAAHTPATIDTPAIVLDTAVLDTTPSRENGAEKNSTPPDDQATGVAADVKTGVETGPPAADVVERPWQEVVRRNMFSAGGGMTIAKSVKLSAITEDAKGVKQAWFRNLQQGPTQTINLGQTLSQGPLSAKVIELTDEAAILQIEGDRVRVQIGQVIADGVAIMPAENN
jgi:hypothetical protein